MKKALLLLFVLALAFSLCACRATGKIAPAPTSTGVVKTTDNVKVSATVSPNVTNSPNDANNAKNNKGAAVVSPTGNDLNTANASAAVKNAA